MVQIDYEDTSLQIDGVDIETRHPISDVIEVDKVVIALLDPPGDGTDKNNVIGFATDGTKLWEIEDPDYDGYSTSVFKNIQTEDGSILLKNWNSFEYKLDPEDGSIEQVGKWDR